MPGRLFEFMLNALRLTDGFSSELFEARTGLPIQAAMPGLENGGTGACSRPGREADGGRRPSDGGS
jgi:hypothetical protein